MRVSITAIVRAPASSVARCAAVSMPAASPDTTVTPAAASLINTDESTLLASLTEVVRRAIERI